MEFKDLLNIARKSIDLKKVGENIKKGKAVCVLETENGNIYFGYSYGFSGFGYCAEQTAILNMLHNKEYCIHKMVTLDSDGRVLTPCGRCSELISYTQNSKNILVMVDDSNVVLFNDIYPYDWKKNI